MDPLPRTWREGGKMLLGGIEFTVVVRLRTDTGSTGSFGSFVPRMRWDVCISDFKSAYKTNPDSHVIWGLLEQGMD
jgi:hypothetical protein